MKVIIPQSDLLESLKTVGRAVSGANTLPVLGNILIKAEGRKLHFAATNLEISISTSVEADIKNEGAITVPAKILTSYTSLLGKGEEVELKVEDGAALGLNSKSSKTTWEYPKLAAKKKSKNVIFFIFFYELVNNICKKINLIHLALM